MDSLTLKYRVGEILKKNKSARNSDTVLWILLVQEYHGSFISEGKINIWDIICLPKQSDVERHRRKYNRKYMYLPTEKEIAKSRKLNMERWLAEIRKENLNEKTYG